MDLEDIVKGVMVSLIGRPGSIDDWIELPRAVHDLKTDRDALWARVHRGRVRPPAHDLEQVSKLMR